MTDQEKIKEALKWFGYPEDTEVDICESGQVYAGLAEILPEGSVEPCDE